MLTPLSTTSRQNLLHYQIRCEKREREREREGGRKEINEGDKVGEGGERVVVEGRER